MLGRVVVLARRDQGAFGASLVDEEVTLELNGGLFEFSEAFLFEKSPNLLFRHILAFGDDFPLFIVKGVVKTRILNFEALIRAHIGHSLSWRQIHRILASLPMRIRHARIPEIGLCYRTATLL